jgi:hypothetical protein
MIWDDVSCRMSLESGRTDCVLAILIEGTALAAHFNFMHQAGVATTDLLARYKSLAAEKACLVPSPPAFG